MFLGRFRYRYVNKLVYGRLSSAESTVSLTENFQLFEV